MKIAPKQQRTKIEKFKQETNYHCMRNLFKQYNKLPDAPPGCPGTPLLPKPVVFGQLW